MQPKIDTSRPHPARMYDFYLGGKNNFAADRETGQQLMRIVPTIRTSARENRAFLGRAVSYLVSTAGIRQFLDIGTGLPSSNNVHEVAQGIVPACRIAYVDNDPIVLSHARALLTSAPGGHTSYTQADLREPERILADAMVRETIDFSKPAALMLVGILHFLSDSDEPAKVVATLIDALPSGSYLVASHATHEYRPDKAEPAARVYNDAGVNFQFRTSDDFADIAFRGLELVDPGLVSVAEWRPIGDDPRPLASEVGCNGGVARKP